MLKKHILKIICVFILIVIYIYIVAIDAIPNNFVIFEGESIKVNSMLGLNLEEEETVSTNIRKRKFSRNKKTQIKLIREHISKRC